MKTAASRPVASEPLPEHDLNAVRRVVAVRGEREAATLLQISRQTLGRCLAALPINRGTAVLVRERLRAIQGRDEGDGGTA